MRAERSLRNRNVKTSMYADKSVGTLSKTKSNEPLAAEPSLENTVRMFSNCRQSYIVSIPLSPGMRSGKVCDEQWSGRTTVYEAD